MSLHSENLRAIEWQLRCLSWAFPSDSVLQTESAREARKSFYCELCQKGYSRINEFEAHEGSYDHQHKKVCLLLYHLGCEA